MFFSLLSLLPTEKFNFEKSGKTPIQTTLGANQTTLGAKREPHILIN
jgi:hypothetical protein